MIYEFMRVIAGPYIRSLVDYYINYQSIFNGAVVMGGFVWLVYKGKNKKQEDDKKKNFPGIEL